MLVCDEEQAPHLVPIYGGKLTGYRATAQKVMRKLSAALPARERTADTATLALPVLDSQPQAP